MKMELPDIPAEERTPLVESLLAIIRIQQDRIQQLEETAQHLRDEIAVLKGQKPRPDIKPSLLEATKPKTAGQEGSKRPGSAKRPKTAELHIHHEVPLHVEDLPEGAAFRGYEAYVVQELIIQNDNTRYLRKSGYRWPSLLFYKLIVTLDAPVQLIGKALQFGWRRLRGRHVKARKSLLAMHGFGHFLVKGLVPFWLA